MFAAAAAPTPCWRIGRDGPGTHPATEWSIHELRFTHRLSVRGFFRSSEPGLGSEASANDCASTGNNSCGGSARRDGDKKAWIFVPASYCERIGGGSAKPA
jgi:hypothetical protein